MGFAYFAADWVDMDWTAMMSVVAVAFDGKKRKETCWFFVCLVVD